MTDHVGRKRLFDNIPDEEERCRLVARCALDETDKKIIIMRYVKHNDFGYIADAVGLSYPAVIKRHKKALVLLQALSNARVNSV